MASIIIRNCNQCELNIPLKIARRLYDDLTVRHPNAFYLKQRVKNWDGKINFIKANGTFKIGLLPRIYNLCKIYGCNPTIVDNRRLIQDGKVVKKVGDYKLRPEQIKAISSVINNKVSGVPYHIGVIDYTVNAGKSLIMSGLYLSYKRQLKTLLITNDSDWLQQAKMEFKQYLPDEKITFIQGSKVFNWSNFSIGMIQSLSRNIRVYQEELAKVDMVLVDEADLAGSKMYQTVITHLYNTRIRIGLSGTIYMSKLAKDRLNNLNLESFFGQKIAEYKLSQSIKEGHSSNVIVKMIPQIQFWYTPQIKSTEYKDIYDEVITNNKLAFEVVSQRLRFNIKYGRLPALVVCKYINHCENIYSYLRQYDQSIFGKLRIERVHVNTRTKERNKIIQDFREGKVDILVSTTIVARGKNFPLLKCLINAASMDSQEKTIQFLGRLVRTHKSKNKVYLDDIWYPGDYLERHGKHRKRYYQSEGLKVIDMGRIWKKYDQNTPLPF